MQETKPILSGSEAGFMDLGFFGNFPGLKRFFRRVPVSELEQNGAIDPGRYILSEVLPSSDPNRLLTKAMTSVNTRRMGVVVKRGRKFQLVNKGVRITNEDFVLVVGGLIAGDGSRWDLYGVFDGVSTRPEDTIKYKPETMEKGFNRGAHASMAAAKYIAEYVKNKIRFRSQPERLGEMLKEAFIEASDKLKAYSHDRKLPQQIRPHTTGTALLVKRDSRDASVVIAHCGDSRGYLYSPERSGTVEQVTEDHFEIFEVPTPEGRFTMKRIITGYLGKETEGKPQEKPVVDVHILQPTVKGSLFVLMTDGAFEPIGRRSESYGSHLNKPRYVDESSRLTRKYASEVMSEAESQGRYVDSDEADKIRRKSEMRAKFNVVEQIQAEEIKRILSNPPSRTNLQDNAAYMAAAATQDTIKGDDCSIILVNPFVK